MSVEEVRAILAAHSDELRELGVASLTLFGSVARGEAREQSDVDLLVELSRPMGLLGLGAIQDRLEELLACQVDLGTAESLRPWLVPEVERDRVDVWPLVA